MIHTLKMVPGTLDEFSRELPGYTATPEGAVAGCIGALMLMAGDPETGLEAMKLLAPGTSESILRLAKGQLTEAPWLARSYFSGTAPENGYELPEEIAISMETNLYSGSPQEGSVKIFVGCSGADSSRPVTVTRGEDGTWRPREWSSLIVGIRKPL